MHTIYWPDLATTGEQMVITGDEAHHAVRVKRLEVGDALRLCDGAGRWCSAKIDAVRKSGKGDWEVSLAVQSCELAPRGTPAIIVCASAPKGDRLEEMVDGLSQVGAHTWRPLISARTIVEPRDGKLARLERVTIESLKQCGRAWKLAIGASITLDEVLAMRTTGTARIVLADVSGAPSLAVPLPDHEPTHLLIGPEGGWTPQELAAARSAGAEVVSIGIHTMRTETAAVVAAAMLVSQSRQR